MTEWTSGWSMAGSHLTLYLSEGSSTTCGTTALFESS